MSTVAVAIICKTPEAGKSKTRLSPPLTPQQCAELSACFIRDLSTNLNGLTEDGQVAGYALYTPAGSEDRLSRLLPAPFGLVLQSEGDLGARLHDGVRDLLALGHKGAIIVSSDSPTLPRATFEAAVDHLLAEDCVVLCPALDGGYTFIGLNQPHPELFTDMPWSTEDVHRLTVERARASGLPVYNLPMWYDVDEAETLAVLRDDLAGAPLPFTTASDARMSAPVTAAYLANLDGQKQPDAFPVKAEASPRPLVLLALLGLVLVGLTGFAPSVFEVWREPGFVAVLMATGLVALLASFVIRGAPEGAALAIILIAAAAVRIVAIADPPLLSTDIYRYVWDGRVQGAGINPFRYVPSDPALTALRDAAVYPNINRADYAHTAYPPVAQMFFFLATRFGDTIDVMRLALVVCEIGIVGALLVLLKRLERPRGLIVAYAWHPLAIWEIANGGHIDALAAMLAVVGVMLLVINRRMLGALVIACGVLVKPYLIVMLPAFWRPWEIRTPLLVLLLVAALYLPYASVGTSVIGFVPTYLQEEGFVAGSGFWLVSLARALFGDRPGILEAYAVFAVLALGLATLRVLSRPATYAPRDQVQDAVVLLFVGLFLLSPNYPWYYLALVPFVPLLNGGVLWVITLFALMLNIWWPTPGDPTTRFLVWKSVMNVAWIAALVGTWMIERNRRRIEMVAAPATTNLSKPIAQGS